MSSSAVPITVAVVISVLFCTIRVYYWYKARVRPPPYSSDSSYDIENQAMIAGGGGGGQPLDIRPSSPPGAGGTTLTIVTSTDISHPHASGSKSGRHNIAATTGLHIARPSSSLYHTVIRSVSFPAQQATATSKATSVTRAGAETAATSQKNTVGHLDPSPVDTTPTSSPSGSPCVSSTASHNNSSEAIHPATTPSKPCPSTQTPDNTADSTAAPAAPFPGLIQTAVSGSWLAMLKHQRYKRVASPATPTSTSSPSAVTSLPPAHHTTGPARDSTAAPTPASPAPAPPMLVVQPCTPRPFAFHAPSPTTPSPTPTASASASAPILKPRVRARARRKSAGHGPMNLFRQMYAATPPLVETDEESEEDEGEAEAESQRTGSGTSIVSESGDSFADSLVERGRLLPAGGRASKARRVAGKKGMGGVESGGAGAGDSGRVGARGGSVDRLEMAAVGEKAGAEVVHESESRSLEEDMRESEGEEKPITGDGARDAANDDMDPKRAAKAGGKGRHGAKTASKGSASPKSVKSVKAISKKSKRSRRMSV